MSYLLPCLYEPAPQLHTISIRAVGTQRLVHCPSSLFGFHTPNLRHLELVGIHLPFDSPLFRDLKTLVLCPGPECFFKPTPAEIANILISCPDLERLSLSLTLKEGTSSSSHDAFSDSPIQSVVVPLRSLGCFELRRVSPSTAHRILQMVELPESCLISCSVDTPDTYSQHRYADVVSILPSTFTSRDRLRGLDEILRLNISESSNDGSIKVEGWASHNKMALDLEFSYSTTRTPPWRPFLTSIGGPSLPLTRLRHLILRNVGEHPHLSETACIQILQRLSSLERLTISGRNLESLILAIAVPRTRSNSDSGRWICPNLKNLELVFPGRWTVQSLTMLVENRLDCDDVRTMESVELKGTIQVMREGDFGLEELAKKVQLIADPLRLVKSKEKGVECSGKRGRGESSTWIGDDWARDDYNW
ncbi:hypothetical protein FRC03_010581 [Tulasnella sp. 419]|nr:hypothetical protein FRC03_010581 [Tulasnella sp. 419]